MKKIKIIIIGCGKVTEIFHLPVAAASEDFEVAALVDTNLLQARLLAEKYNIPVVENDFRKLYGKVDAAIVAVPHHLHSGIAIELLQNGIHVLVEKPMALKSAECDKMIKVADHAGVILSVGLLRRYYEASKFVKQMLDKKMLGEILSFDFREGSVFSWGSASDFMFRTFAGGGVLVDSGIHVLDTLLWWLGDYEEVVYYDDVMGGVEANALINIGLQSGAKGIVELSRTRNLRNTCVIHGELGSLEVGSGVNPVIKLQTADMGPYFSGQVLKSRMDRNNKDVFARQLNDFAQAITNLKPSFVPGSEGRRSVEIMETCYTSRRQLTEPWMPTVRERI